MVRAAAIVAGLGFTVAGFVSARSRVPSGSASRAETVAPVLPLIVDLDAPSTVLPVRNDRYGSALCLVMRDGDPIAKTRVDLDGDELLSCDLLRHMASQPPRSGGDPKQAAGTVTVQAAAISTMAPCAGVTVVIATRNRPDQLVQCVTSVLSGTIAPDRVVVVDNAPSGDRAAELVSRLAEHDLRITYVREDRPGLANAHNAALPHLAGEVVAFTDDDVLVHQRWLERLVRAFADDQQVVCVTGMIAPRELDTLPQQWVEGQAIYDKGLQRRVFDTGAHRPDDPLFPYTAGALGSGANMAFRADYLTASGGFDTALGAGTLAMGGDDLAAFYDVVRSGHRLVYEPSAIVLHEHHREWSALRRQVYGYGAGLGAHLTRCLLRDPRTAWVLLRNGRATSRRATQILHPSIGDGLPPYPQELSREQRRGLMSGPWRYLLSRNRARIARRKALQ
ncbi:MAG: glycosyltransferase [Streptosporangiales bacterium]